MFIALNPVIHPPLRLSIMSLLVLLKEEEFTNIQVLTHATAGNISIQLKKLKKAEYIEIIKKFKDNYPMTVCKITPKGLQAFDEYVTALKSYIELEPGI